MPMCGNCKQHHDTVRQVRDCYVSSNRIEPAFQEDERSLRRSRGSGSLEEKGARGGQAAQVAGQGRAVGGIGSEPSLVGLAGDHGATAQAPNGAPAQGAQVPIDVPAKGAPAQAYEAKRGDVHFIDGIYYRIHIAQKSGYPYAARAIITANARWAADGSLLEPGTIQWQYERGLIRRLREDTLTTAAQAAAFGKLVGRCCFCSHAIDTPESTAVGYGPVCATKYDLPWGDTTQEASL
jgi:hypothetical protein